MKTRRPRSMPRCPVDPIVEELTNARYAARISQRRLAELAETSQGVVSDIENGRTNPGLALVRKIAEALDYELGARRRGSARWS